MRKNLITISFLIIGLFSLSYCQGKSNYFGLYKLEFNPEKIDECGDLRLSSTALWTLNGTVIEIDSLGFFICRLSSDQISSQNDFKIYKIKLAGVDFNQDIKKIVEMLNALLKHKKVIVITTDSEFYNLQSFYGVIEYEDFDINYSLLKNGLAKFRSKAYTLDFWRKCKYENVSNNSNRR